jgi:hypothetical protein
VNSLIFGGITQPLGYFDPLGFAKNKQQHELVKLREAELKHGRWGMISSLAILNLSRYLKLTLLDFFYFYKIKNT